MGELKKSDSPSYNNFSPRVKKDKTYKDRSDSESSEDEDGNPRNKSKFFKHTEKERREEKHKRREERKRQTEEGDDYDPGEEDRGRKRRLGEDDDSGPEDDSWLKRRRMNDPDDEPPSNLDNYVPKKVTREIKKKYLPEARKLDSDEIMESSNFLKFRNTMELIFETAEDINLSELADDDDDSKDIPVELVIQRHHAAVLASESSKLKSMSTMDQIPTERLVKIL